MTADTFRSNLPSYLGAVLLVLFLPSFFYQNLGKNVCAGMTYIGGCVIGLTAAIQEPMLLTINPFLALVGIIFVSKKR